MIEDAALRGDPVAAPLSAPEGVSLASDAVALSVLHEVLSALSHDQPVEEILRMLAERVGLLTASGSTAIALLDSDREHVTFAAAAGQEAEELVGSRVRVADTVLGNTARTGEPYLAFRPLASPALQENGSTSPSFLSPGSAAVVPIFDQGMPAGALAALGKAGGVPYGGTDLLCLSTLAAVASVVLRNSRLRADTDRQGRELSILYDAVRNVSGQISAQEVLLTVVEQVRKHMDTAAVAIFLTNDEHTHLYIAEDEGLGGEDREVTLPADTGLGRALLEGARPAVLRFVDADDVPLPAVALPSSLESALAFVRDCEPIFSDLAGRSALAAPIRSGDEAYGLVVALSSQSPGVYTAADANLLSALASQAAVAMENAWLYEDATRRAEEAAALYELSQTVTSSLRLPQVLERVADSVLSLLSVDKFALFLHQRKSETLELVVARNLAPGAEDRLRPQIGRGIPGWVMEFETPTAVQDVAADHRNASAPLHTEGVVSMTCMPLQVGAATIGVLCAMSERRRLFTVAEMELLYTIANQAAIAIENARIYADVRQKSLELRRYFHRVARALGSSHSPEEVPEMIATLTLEVMGADRCTLYAVKRAPEEGPLLVCAASAGFKIAVNPFSAPRPCRDEMPTGWVARRARALAIMDLNEDARFAVHYDRPLRGRVSSYLGVPLRIEGEVVGVLEVYTRDPRTWRADEMRLMLTFASQAAVAFQNARLARESGDAERSARLRQVLLAMATRRHPATPEAVAHALTEHLPIRAAAIFTRVATGSWQRRSSSPVSADKGIEEALATVMGMLDQGREGHEDILLATDDRGEVAIAVLTEAAAADDALVTLPEVGLTPLLRDAAFTLSREFERYPETIP